MRNFVRAMILMVAVLSVTACDDLEFSEKRVTAQGFMDSLLEGNQDKAFQLSSKNAESKISISMLTEALKLKRKTESINTFRFVYLSEGIYGPNDARVVFSQSIDGKVESENLVVHLIFSEAENKWLVDNIVIR